MSAIKMWLISFDVPFVHPFTAILFRIELIKTYLCGAIRIENKIIPKWFYFIRKLLKTISKKFPSSMVEKEK